MEIWTASNKEKLAAVSSMKMELNDVKAENLKLKKMIHRMQFQMSNKDEDFELMESSLDDLKQEKLQNNVWVVDLDENGNDMEDIQKLAKDHKLKLKETDIIETVRLGKSGGSKKNRDLIVERPLF